MKLIVGLGNPGDKYLCTRHNVGFIILDKLNKEYGLSGFKYESKFKGDISSGNIDGHKVILIKPQTFMNLSGESVSAIVNYYNIDKSDILIIYDDISMDFGKVRHRLKGSHGGHNGLKDISRYYGQELPRIKIGVGHDKRYELSNWVLSKFSEEELIDIDNGVFKIVTEILFDKFLKND